MDTGTDVAACPISGGCGGIGMVILLAVAVFMLISAWKVFTKAGQPGWGCLIPFYNVYLLLKIAGKPGWWLILLFVPLINLIVLIIATIGVARNFGKGGGFGVGLTFLPIVFFPILAFGSARYAGGQAPAA